MSIPTGLSQTDDTRIRSIVTLPPPKNLLSFYPIAGTPVERSIRETRQIISHILNGLDKRLLVIVGPCSIHDPKAALEYAKKLAILREQHRDTLEIIMRTYFEKPRTTVGWKGFINDPHLDGSFAINEGLRMARDLLININKLGVPVATEFLDTISPQYIADLISWGAIGARTTESQVHRELASGLSCPIGFKNGTDGNVKIAVDAMLTSAKPHHFLGIGKEGTASIVTTTGNSDTHIILRGSNDGTNYDQASIETVVRILESYQVSPRVMVDASHGNSQRNWESQSKVIGDLVNQIRAGHNHVFGVMIESHLNPGKQPFTPGTDDPSTLRYGTSITDGCQGFEDTVIDLERLSEAVKSRIQ